MRTSSGVASAGKLIVLLTALSQCFCQAAWILTWVSGFISSAVLKSFWMSFGTPLVLLTLPVFAMVIMRDLL